MAIKKKNPTMDHPRETMYPARKRDLESALNFVKYDFDPDAARFLIAQLYRGLSEDWPLHEGILREFISHAFGRIVNEKVSADVAFGLNLARGKYPRKDTVPRDLVAVAHIVRLMRSGVKRQIAQGDVANRMFPDGKGDRALDFAYSQYHKLLAALPSSVLDDMFPPTLVNAD